MVPSAVPRSDDVAVRMLAWDTYIGTHSIFQLCHMFAKSLACFIDEDP